MPMPMPSLTHSQNKQEEKMIAINFFLLVLLFAPFLQAHDLPHAHSHDAHGIFQQKTAALTQRFSQKLFNRGMFKNEKVTMRVNLRAAAASSNDPATLIAYQYSSNNECGGDPNIASGYPFHVCMTGYSQDGNVIGSGIYQAKSQDEQYLYVAYTEFSTADCTGNPTLSDSFAFPTTCIGGTNNDPDSLFQSFRVSLVPGTDLSSYFKSGVLFNYYDSNDHCTAHAASTSFTWVSLNQCMPGDDGSSFQFMSCAPHRVTASVFSDNRCSVPVSTSDMPLVKCVADDEPVLNDSGMAYGVIQSGECI